MEGFKVFSLYDFMTGSCRPSPFTNPELEKEPSMEDFQRVPPKTGFCQMESPSGIRFWCDAIYSTKGYALPSDWAESCPPRGMHDNSDNDQLWCYIHPVTCYFNYIPRDVGVAIVAECSGNTGSITLSKGNFLCKMKIMLTDTFTSNSFRDFSLSRQNSTGDQLRRFWWLAKRAQSLEAASTIVFTDGTNGMVMVPFERGSTVRFHQIQGPHPSILLAACWLWQVASHRKILPIPKPHPNFSTLPLAVEMPTQSHTPQLLKVGDRLSLKPFPFEPRFSAKHYPVAVTAKLEAQLDPFRRNQDAGLLARLQENHIECVVRKLIRVGQCHAQIVFCTLTGGGPIFCAKVYDDSFYPLPQDDVYDYIPDTSPNSHNIVKEPMDVTTNEFYSYERLRFCQGSMIPWCYGAFYVGMPDGRTLPGIVQEALTQEDGSPADTMVNEETETWSAEAKMDLVNRIAPNRSTQGLQLYQLRLAARCFRSALVEHDDVVGRNILLISNPKSSFRSIVVIDFGFAKHHFAKSPTLTRPKWSTYGDFHNLIISLFGKGLVDHWWSEEFRADQYEIPLALSKPLSGLGAEPSISV